MHRFLRSLSSPASTPVVIISWLILMLGMLAVILFGHLERLEDIALIATMLIITLILASALRQRHQKPRGRWVKAHLVSADDSDD